MAETFASYLRRNHIRLSDLARDAGVKSITTLWNWQQGDARAPYRPNVQKVAAALHISPDDLFALIEEGYYEKHPEARPNPPVLDPAA